MHNACYIHFVYLGSLEQCPSIERVCDKYEAPRIDYGLTWDEKKSIMREFETYLRALERYRREFTGVALKTYRDFFIDRYDMSYGDATMAAIDFGWCPSDAILI